MIKDPYRIMTVDGEWCIVKKVPDIIGMEAFVTLSKLRAESSDGREREAMIYLKENKLI